MEPIGSAGAVLKTSWLYTNRASNILLRALLLGCHAVHVLRHEVDGRKRSSQVLARGFWGFGLCCGLVLPALLHVLLARLCPGPGLNQADSGTAPGSGPLSAAGGWETPCSSTKWG